MAWLSGWDKRIELKIEDYAGDIGAEVTWFPATVFLDETQGEEVFTELTTNAEYLKVAFTKADGTTELYAEKELFQAGFTSQYPPTQSDTYVKSTSKWGTGYWAYYATDPAKSLTGVSGDNSWASSYESITNQRFHIDLGSAKIIERIYYENAHSEGAGMEAGVQNFTFWGSNTGAGTFDDLVYANNEGWTELTVATNAFLEHIGADQADPKYITVTNAIAYRYYAFKFADNYGAVGSMGVRRIELQEAPKAVYHVSRDGWVINANTSIYMYYDKDHADNTTYIGAINTTPGAAVWDGNFKAVYHMVDDNGNVDDSTSNNNDGTKKAANEPIEVTGKVGQGQDFDGDNDIILVSHSGSLADISDLTIEVVVYPHTWTASYDYYCDKSAIAGDWLFCHDRTQGKEFFRHEFSTSYGSWLCPSLDLNDWSYLAVTYNNSAVDNNPIMYINSAAQALDEDQAPVGTAKYSTGPVGMGNRSDEPADRQYDGLMDEKRISNTIRSATWMKGTYNSLWDTLFTYGSEEVEVRINAIFFGSNF